MSLLSKMTTKDVQDTETEAPAARPARPSLSSRFTQPVGRRRATGTTSSAVNLLSPWVLDELRVRRLRRRFVVGAIVMALLVAATWGMLRVNLMRAESDLRSDQSTGDALTQQINGFGDVRLYVGNVQVRSASVESIMETQIGYASVLGTLERGLPPGAEITAITVTLPPNPETLPAGTAPDPTAALCPGPDPFGAVTVVGCVTISGTADSRADVSSMVQAFGRSMLFIEPFISSTTAGSEEGPSVQFEGSLGLSEETFTGRFVDVAGLDDKTTDTTGTNSSTTSTTTSEGSR